MTPRGIIIMVSENNKQLKKRKNEYMKEYYKNNNEKIREQCRIRRLNRIEICRKQNRESNKRCKERIKKYDAKYRQTDKYKKYQKKYGIENREKLNKLNNEWLDKNPKMRIKAQLKSSLLKYIKRYDGKALSLKRYNINWDELVKHLINCIPKDYERGKYHIDHIKPFCSFNLNDPKEVRKVMAAENHQWLLAKENMSKGGSSDKLLKYNGI